MASPLTGLRVVEVTLGVSLVGAGLAGSLPGSLLRDFGASVTRIRAGGSSLDEGVEFERAWNRGKSVSTPDDVPGAVRALAAEADVLFLAGPEELIEQQGLGTTDLLAINPRLVAVRIRPSSTALGPLPDLELLVGARTGLLTQIRGHREGPKFNDLPVASAGAGVVAAVGALAKLYEREAIGVGGWAETSLVDGLQAILPMIIGRVGNPSGTTRLLWEQQGPSETLAYPCGDGRYLQLWFGAKGAYEAWLERMGDPSSEKGYTADLVSGAMTERATRWRAKLATQERDTWVAEFAGEPFRCEPVLRPGEALTDPHVVSTGLSVAHDGLTVLGPIGSVTPVPGSTSARVTNGTLLDGVRVLDLSAYLAGPITPLILAELGADVVKVEPLTGDAHRGMEPMFAAGQRGKRALALDMKSAAASAVLASLFAWSDVVHHNSRVGLAEKLGYDEASVRTANDSAVYCFASGFGPTGPRARLAANDHLMQALSGVEASQGGNGQPPTFLVWGAIDVLSGWIAAVGILAGLYARRRSGQGQSVSTSLLGAALTLKSGAFRSGETLTEGPRLDANQTGYGAAYRIYQAQDGAWLALAVDSPAAWARLGGLVPGLPASPPPLRTADGAPQDTEAVLEQAFSSAPAVAWVSRLHAADVPAELVLETDRAGFIGRVLDDPVGRQLGRTVGFAWGDRGQLDQPGFPLRFESRTPAAPSIPRLGQHTHEVLAEVGFDEAAREELVASQTVTPPE